MTAPFFQAALRVRDLSLSARFYAEHLGFRTEPAGGGCLSVTGPGGASLLLAPAGADLAPWPGVKQVLPTAWVYLHRPGLPAWSQELVARAVPHDGPVEPYPGFRQLRVDDPDGYALIFYEPLPLPDEQILEMYAAGPARLREALAGLSEEGLALRWAPGKWSIRQVVHHIVDSDLATFHTLRLALADPGRTIQADIWDPDDWMTNLRTDSRPVEPALALFEAAHAWVCDVLAHLPGALDRTVVWPSGYRADVRTLLRQVGGHALHHISQIAQARSGHP